MQRWWQIKHNCHYSDIEITEHTHIYIYTERVREKRERDPFKSKSCRVRGKKLFSCLSLDQSSSSCFKKTKKTKPKKKPWRQARISVSQINSLILAFLNIKNCSHSANSIFLCCLLFLQHVKLCSYTWLTVKSVHLRAKNKKKVVVYNTNFLY